jgi:hypothetical protein
MRHALWISRGSKSVLTFAKQDNLEPLGHDPLSTLPLLTYTVPASLRATGSNGLLSVNLGEKFCIKGKKQKPIPARLQRGSRLGGGPLRAAAKPLI